MSGDKKDIKLVINAQMESMSGQASKYYYLVEKQIGQGKGAKYEHCADIDIEPGLDVYQEIENGAAEEWGFGKFRITMYDADGNRVVGADSLRINIKGREFGDTTNPVHDAANYNPTATALPQIPEEEEYEDPIEEDERHYDNEVRLNRARLAALREKIRYEQELKSLTSTNQNENPPQQEGLMAAVLRMQVEQQKLEAQRQEAATERMMALMAESRKKDPGLVEQLLPLLPSLLPLLQPKDPMDNPMVKILMEKALSPPPPPKDPVGEIMPRVVESVTTMYNGLTQRMVDSFLNTKADSERRAEQDAAVQRFQAIQGLIKEVAPVIGGTVRDIMMARRGAQAQQQPQPSSPAQNGVPTKERFQAILQDFIGQFEAGTEKSKILANLLSRYPSGDLHHVATDQNVIDMAEKAGPEVEDFMKTVASVTKGG